MTCNGNNTTPKGKAKKPIATSGGGNIGPSLAVALANQINGEVANTAMTKPAPAENNSTMILKNNFRIIWLMMFLLFL